jgi:TonB family protein
VFSLYAGRLYELLKVTAQRNYPMDAVRRREQGTVLVRMRIDPDGHLLSAHVPQSVTASPRLIEAAMEAAQAAAPYPRFDPGMGDEPATFEVPIIYQVR